MDNLIKASNYIYDFQLEQLYWDRYYVSLLDFITYNPKLSKEKLKKIHIELSNVLKHKEKLQKKLNKRLEKTYYWDSERRYKEKLKKLKKNDTKQITY